MKFSEKYKQIIEDVSPELQALNAKQMNEVEQLKLERQKMTPEEFKKKFDELRQKHIKERKQFSNKENK